MQAAMVISQQILVMFFYMMCGFALYKSGKLTKQGSREIAHMLLWLIVPIVLLQSFCVEFSVQKLLQLAVSAGLGGLSLLLSIVLARLLFHKNPIENFAVAFSNAGFLGLPLVQATLGEHAVFYVVGFVSLLNVLQWTYGVSVLTGERKTVSIKSIFLNPIIIGVLAGFVLFCTGLGTRLPGVLRITLESLSRLNAPLAMIILGCYLAQTELRSLVTTARLYVVSFARLILVPLLTIALLLPMPVPSEMKLAVLICAIAPVGANVAVYAQLNDLDYSYACKAVTQSTVLSLIAMPLLLLLATTLFG